MLAVIPARKGSKGVPNKNIKLLNGKPLMAYTIHAALESGIFKKIIVSTDSNEIAQIAAQYGAEIPFLRPEDIAGDLASSDDVVLHALNFYKEQGILFEEVCKLQPTSPLRNAGHIQAAYKLFVEKESDFVVSVCECEHSPQWCGIIGEDLRLDSFISESAKRAGRQELPSYFRLNGAIYMGKTEKYIKNKNFLGHNSFAYIMKQEESVDIDSILDFKIAEMILQE